MARTFRLHQVERGVVVKVDAKGSGQEIANCLNSFGDQQQNASFIADTLECSLAFETAVRAIIDATQAYLPPNGISKNEFVHRVIEATDNIDVIWAIETADEHVPEPTP